MMRMDPRKIGEDRIIDTSSLDAQKLFFHSTFETWGQLVQDENWALERFIANCEGLIMWRDRTHTDHMEIIDDRYGEFVMPYKDALAHLRADGTCPRTGTRPPRPDPEREMRGHR